MLKRSETAAPSSVAIEIHTGMSSGSSGTSGTTSTAPMRGCSPAWCRRSIRSTATAYSASNAARTAAASPTSEKTVRLWAASEEASSRSTPGLLRKSGRQCIDDLGASTLTDVGNSFDQCHRAGIAYGHARPLRRCIRSATCVCLARSNTAGRESRLAGAVSISRVLGAMRGSHDDCEDAESRRYSRLTLNRLRPIMAHEQAAGSPLTLWQIP